MEISWEKDKVSSQTQMALRFCHRKLVVSGPLAETTQVERRFRKCMYVGNKFSFMPVELEVSS